jgi:hypothetical protein
MFTKEMEDIWLMADYEFQETAWKGCRCWREGS